MRLLQAVTESYQLTDTPGVVYNGEYYYHNPYRKPEGRFEFIAMIGSFSEHTLFLRFNTGDAKASAKAMLDYNEYTPIGARDEQHNGHDKADQ